ncbi:MAG: metal-sulfur cluster assembly factor [Bacteroidetes bacterium]|nr:metal-sulfur cluster assembly factor [Bacteroidota bacterium]
MNDLEKSKKIKNQVYEILKEVIDPELGLNIIDLGLVYNIAFQPENTINILLTLTSPGCPMGEAIMDDIKYSIKKPFPDYEVVIELTFEPAWSTEKVSEEGRVFLSLES